MRATVAVCTRDRARLLEQCLSSLATQLVDADELEVLVVDNGSTDDTRDVLRTWAGAAAGRRWALEPRVGVAHARNAALEASDREVVAFVDDDALVPPTWARTHLHAFESGRRIGAVGGPVGLVWPTGRPEWVSDALTQWFSALDLTDEAGPYPNDHGPYGTNMSVWREAALAVGGFDPRFGRRGRSLRSGEEPELSRRLVAAGWTLHYAPAAAVVQQVLPERLQLRWLLRRGWAQGTTDARLDVVARSRSRRARLTAAAGELRTTLDSYRRRRDGGDEIAELVLVAAHAGTASGLARSVVAGAGTMR